MDSGSHSGRPTQRTNRARWLRIALPLVIAATSTSSTATASDAEDPHVADAVERVRTHLRERLTPPSARASTRAAEPAFGVTSGHRDAQTGMTHLYLRQRIGDIDVHGTSLSVTVEDGGEVHLDEREMERRWMRTSLSPPGAAPFAGAPAAADAARSEPNAAWPAFALSAVEALRAAAQHLGLEVAAHEGDDDPLEVSAPSGPTRASRFVHPSWSRDEIPIELAYLRDERGTPRLCWSAVLRTPDGQHWWHVYVDADSGDLLRSHDWYRHERYEVFALPLESPDEGDRTILENVADPVASPFGWHDTNGIAGPEFTDTRGNNVAAQEDVDDNDAGGMRPDGGDALDFTFPLDLTDQPSNAFEAGLANLFYVSNVVHDVLHGYGFDEAAGNFQQNNYGRGGSQNDPVIADSLDGAGLDNARFGTPPDGSAPRMEMFRWQQAQSPRVIVLSPLAASGTIFAARAQFGGGTLGLSGSVVRALDAANATGPTTTDACTPLTNEAAVAGNIALVDRGVCTFVSKVANAQAAGAIGVIIANNGGDAVGEMAGFDTTLEIPALFIETTEGASLVAEIGNGLQATLISPAPRDSSLDNGVVIHEYGHGVTNRLTGGRANVGCLSDSESAAMGEGWSDWFALVFTAMPGDRAEDPRGISPFLVGEPLGGGGIRNNAYSTSFSVAPATYAVLADPNLNLPHGGGEIWAGALWGLYWKFVERYGFDPDLSGGSGGNNRALQLVIDALKMQPCNPTFVEGRDALLSADQATNGGANECAIWEAFATRGIGANALDGGSATSLDVTEDFSVPASCVPEADAWAAGLTSSLALGALARRRTRTQRRCAKR